MDFLAGRAPWARIVPWTREGGCVVRMVPVVFVAARAREVLGRGRSLEGGEAGISVSLDLDDSDRCGPLPPKDAFQEPLAGQRALEERFG